MNTTVALFMSALDGSIVLVALPAIFRGIHMDVLAAGNVGYLLWMIMSYRMVQAVSVVTFGRLGDIYGRVRIYDAGFAVFAFASLLLSFDPFDGPRGAIWLIAWRSVQALGGSMLMANSAALLTDAFPVSQRGLALGINQIAGLAGQFLGLLAGALVLIDWRAVFWINVPVGIAGAITAYLFLQEVSTRHKAPIDWWGNVTFALGLGALLIAVTEGVQPYGGGAMGWTNPAVIAQLAGGTMLLVVFFFFERSVPAPMFAITLFRIRAFACGNLASLLSSITRGGLQFMLVIWLQGIWLPLRGVDYADTPLWAGICMLPLTAGFLVAGPLSGFFSDQRGSRTFATAGMLVTGASYVGLILLPIEFPYWLFAVLLAANGIGAGMFSAPNTSSIMSSVPAKDRGAASGMRATFQNSGTALSIGIFFSLMIAGLSRGLPQALSHALRRFGVPAQTAQAVGNLPPVASLFAALLGVNPVRQLLTTTDSSALTSLPQGALQTLTGKTFFPHLIGAPFHEALVTAFVAAAAMSLVAAVASFSRGTPVREI